MINECIDNRKSPGIERLVIFIKKKYLEQNKMGKESNTDNALFLELAINQTAGCINHFSIKLGKNEKNSK